jgi:outer membrane protein TolC
MNRASPNSVSGPEIAVAPRAACHLRCVLLWTVLLLLPAGQAPGQAVLDWPTCVKETVQNNPNLSSAREKIRQAEANKTITQSGGRLQVSGSAGAGLSKSSGSDQSDSYSYGASAQQLLFDGGKTRYETSQADEQLAASRFSYQSSSSDIRFSLRTAFIGLLKAQDQMVTAKGILKRRDQSAQLVKLRYEAGREHKGSLLTAEAKYAQAQADMARAGRNVKLAQAELSRQMGWSNSIAVLVIGDLKTVNVRKNEPDFDALVGDVPYLKYYASQTRVSRLSVKSARAGFLPVIEANAGADRSGDNWPPDGSQWSAGVSLSLPIFAGGSRVAQVRKALSEERAAVTDERAERDKLLLDLQSAWIQLQNAIDNLEVSRKFIEAAKERAKIAEAQYSNGLLTFDSWIIIEDDYDTAENNFLNAQAGASTAEANWIYAKGGTLENEVN